MQTFIQSPESALYFVQLHWQYATPANAKLSGDHWERTYGDGAFENADASRKMPWYFIESNNSSTVCFGVKTGCKAFCYWNAGNGNLQLTIDTRNGGSGVRLGDRILHAADLLTTKNKNNEKHLPYSQAFLFTHVPFGTPSQNNLFMALTTGILPTVIIHRH